MFVSSIGAQGRNRIREWASHVFSERAWDEGDQEEKFKATAGS
jgi:hypothetical protein